MNAWELVRSSLTFRIYDLLVSVNVHPVSPNYVRSHFTLVIFCQLDILFSLWYYMTEPVKGRWMLHVEELGARIQESAAGHTPSQPKIQSLEKRVSVDQVTCSFRTQSSGMSRVKSQHVHVQRKLQIPPHPCDCLNRQSRLGPLKWNLTPHFPPHPPSCLCSSAGSNEQWRPGRSLSWWRPQTRRYRRKWWWAGPLASARPGTHGSCPWRAGSGTHVFRPWGGSTPCPPLLQRNGK